MAAELRQIAVRARAEKSVEQTVAEFVDEAVLMGKNAASQGCHHVRAFQNERTGEKHWFYENMKGFVIMIDSAKATVPTSKLLPAVRKYAHETYGLEVAYDMDWQFKW
jgi:hypothetical protein